MAFEIFTYGGGDLYRNVFNAIAIIFGNGDYLVAFKLAALIGFLALLLQSAFSGDAKKMNVQWIMIIAFVYLGFLVPKVDVNIKDQTKGALSDQVVSNVPLGLAIVASLPSTAKKFFTELFDQGFSLPGNMNYSTGGLGIGLEIVKRTMDARLHDGDLRMEMQRFFEECIAIDIAYNRFTWGSLINSTDLDGFLTQNLSKSTFFEYPRASGNYRSCGDSWSGIGGLSKDISDSIADINEEIGNFVYGSRDRHDLTKTQMLALTNTTADTAAQYMNMAAQNQSDRLLQSVLGNTLRDSSVALGAKDGASAYIIEKAKAERIGTMQSMGKIAKEMLPIMQHIFEIIIIALFPLVALVFVTPLAAKALQSYAGAIIWVSSWSPLFVIVNFVSSYYAAQVNAGGLNTIAHSGQVSSIMSEYATIAGYLAASIPMISYMLVQRSGAMMAGLAGRAIQSYEGTASRASDEASSGNISTGQYSYNNAAMNQQNLSPSLDAGTVKTNAGGVQENRYINPAGEASNTKKFDQDSFNFDAKTKAGLQQATKADVSESISGANKQAETERADLSTRLDNTINTMKQDSQTLGAELAAMRQDSTTMESDYQAKVQAQNQINSTISELESVRSSISGSGSVGTGGGKGPSASAGYSAGEEDASSRKDDLAFAYQTQNAIGAILKVADGATIKSGGSEGYQNSESSSDALAALRSQALTASSTVDQSITEAEQAVKTQSLMETGGIEFSQSTEREIYDNLADKIGESKADGLVDKLRGGFNNLTEEQQEQYLNALDTWQDNYFTSDGERTGALAAYSNEEVVTNKAGEDYKTVSENADAELNDYKNLFKDNFDLREADNFRAAGEAGAGYDPSLARDKYNDYAIRASEAVFNSDELSTKRTLVGNTAIKDAINNLNNSSEFANYLNEDLKTENNYDPNIQFTGNVTKDMVVTEESPEFNGADWLLRDKK